ncbi:hypothetical protein OJF2_11700 [Aquisphaera giovannonii]|uniref:Virus attachment protein p12 family protein n=1 Tax=Aquisphaera giovannonii TaxID=406548 RepID=A0A5B9VXS9_9BACT|nr:FeoB-associated Cys-rich membrane protein [Aquisphaera giovannonii]QEH32691.1 hypothetical protein OJF2_11700 [Aquisphaera giovannonii]
MDFTWQDLVAMAIVLGAAGYLASLAWSAVRGRGAGGCGGGCAKCSSAAEPVVSIGLPAPR